MNEVSEITLLSATNDWLAHLEAAGYSPRTVALYEQAVLNLDRFLASQGYERAPHAVLHDHLEAWRRSLCVAGCTTGTVDSYVRAVRRLFRWLLVTDRLFSDPAQHFTTVKVRIPLGLCPTEDEMRRLLDSLKGHDRIALRDRALLETAYATGARLEELAKLDLDAIGNGNLRLLGKGGRERAVPLTTAAVRALATYIAKGRSRFQRAPINDNERALFLSIQGGRRMASQAIALVIKRRAKYCGLKVTPHAFRRAFATHLMQGGAALVEVKDLLGHRSFRHLRHYLRLHPSDVLETARNSKPGRR